MAKKKKGLKVGTLISFGAVLLALVAFFLMFAPAAGNNDSYFTGAQMAFGYSKTVEVLGNKVTTSILNFSFLNFLPYLLILIGIVFSGLAVFGKLGKISPIIAAVCYLAAGVLFFCVVPFCSPYVDKKGIGAVNDEYIKQFKEALSLGAGAIVAGILGILSALASVSTLFIKK